MTKGILWQPYNMKSHGDKKAGKTRELFLKLVLQIETTDLPGSEMKRGTGTIAISVDRTHISEWF